MTVSTAPYRVAALQPRRPMLGCKEWKQRVRQACWNHIAKCKEAPSLPLIHSIIATAIEQRRLDEGTYDRAVVHMDMADVYTGREVVQDEDDVMKMDVATRLGEDDRAHESSRIDGMDEIEEVLYSITEDDINEILADLQAEFASYDIEDHLDEGLELLYQEQEDLVQQIADYEALHAIANCVDEEEMQQQSQQGYDYQYAHSQQSVDVCPLCNGVIIQLHADRVVCTNAMEGSCTFSIDELSVWQVCKEALYQARLDHSIQCAEDVTVLHYNSSLWSCCYACGFEQATPTRRRRRK
jgi:hypothetical protein